MHFVKKVPTTEEEKFQKKKEQEKKSKLFLAARDRIFEKRKNGELDDEMLALTQQVLEKNGDHYTLWNIRREVITQKIKDLRKLAEEEPVDKEKVEELEKIIDNLFVSELALTYECIKQNPKSYSAWFERGWVLERQKDPDCVKELQLCEKALKLDCRNFHVWDHRRIVARMAKRTEEQELEFSNNLINENFSNYSAWHYRSVAIKNVQKEKSGGITIDDETIAQEIEKVRSAFYIDAEDQSAWMYTRWLLELGSGKEFLRPDSHSPVVILSASFHGNNSTVVMSRACTLDVVMSFVDVEDSARWRGFSALSAHPKSSKVWQYLSDSPIRITVEENSESSPWIEISQKPFVNKNLLRRAYGLSPVRIIPAIETLINDCESIIKEEPNNKWPLYMKTLCLMEYKSHEAHDEIVNNLKKLAEEIDVKRKQMYEAVASKVQLSNALRNDNLLEKLMQGEEDKLPLRYMNITTLDGAEHLAGLVSNLDLTGNKIVRPEEIVLPNLLSLTLNENPIKRLASSASLGRVSFLSLASTQISSLEDIIPCLQTMSSLQKLLYCETPLVERTKELHEALPGVRLIPYYL